jgi:hypothetical protein
MNNLLFLTGVFFLYNWLTDFGLIQHLVTSDMTVSRGEN